MNGDFPGNDCGCEPWFTTGILAGLRFPWDDCTGYAGVDVCDCDAADRFPDIWAAALALSELTGRVIVNTDLKFHDGETRPCCILANEDGTPMTTAEGDAFVAQWKKDHPVRRALAKRDPNACADPDCERCPRIARRETCSPDCAGWVLDQRGRVEPCHACGLYVDEQAAEAADAFLREHCSGVRVLLCETSDGAVSFYAVLGDDTDLSPRHDSEARARATAAVSAAGYLVAEGEG